MDEESMAAQARQFNVQLERRKLQTISDAKQRQIDVAEQEATAQRQRAATRLVRWYRRVRSSRRAVAATCIQRAARSRQRWSATANSAATVLQAWLRLRCFLRCQCRLKDDSASRIQAAARGHLDRRQVRAHRRLVESHEAARVIQAQYRAFACRLALYKQSKRGKGDALRIQQKMVCLKRAIGDFDELTAATVLQAHWRGRCAREAVSGLFLEEDEYEASLAIQAAYRGHVQRHHKFPHQRNRLVQEREVRLRLQKQQADATAQLRQAHARRAVEAKFSKRRIKVMSPKPSDRSKRRSDAVSAFTKSNLQNEVNAEVLLPPGANHGDRLAHVNGMPPTLPAISVPSQRELNDYYHGAPVVLSHYRRESEMRNTPSSRLIPQPPPPPAAASLQDYVELQDARDRHAHVKHRCGRSPSSVTSSSTTTTVDSHAVLNHLAGHQQEAKHTRRLASVPLPRQMKASSRLLNRANTHQAPTVSVRDGSTNWQPHNVNNQFMKVNSLLKDGGNDSSSSFMLPSLTQDDHVPGRSSPKGRPARTSRPMKSITQLPALGFAQSRDDSAGQSNSSRMRQRAFGK